MENNEQKQNGCSVASEALRKSSLCESNEIVVLHFLILLTGIYKYKIVHALNIVYLHILIESVCCTQMILTKSIKIKKNMQSCCGK